MGWFPASANQAVAGNLTVSGSVTAGGTELLQKQASTGAAGFALTTGTPTIISWTAPSDGNLHRAVVLSALSVTSAMTGGVTQVASGNPDGSTTTNELYPAVASTGGAPQNEAIVLLTVGSGKTVTVEQASSLTVGAATLWAEIWGS